MNLSIVSKTGLNNTQDRLAVSNEICVRNKGRCLAVANMWRNRRNVRHG